MEYKEHVREGTWQNRMAVVLHRLPEEFVYRACPGWKMAVTNGIEEFTLIQDFENRGDDWIELGFDTDYINLVFLDNTCRSPRMGVELDKHLDWSEHKDHSTGCVWGDRKYYPVTASYKDIKKLISQTLKLSVRILVDMPYAALASMTTQPVVLCYADLCPVPTMDFSYDPEELDDALHDIEAQAITQVTEIVSKWNQTEQNIVEDEHPLTVEIEDGGTLSDNSLSDIQENDDDMKPEDPTYPVIHVQWCISTRTKNETSRYSPVLDVEMTGYGLVSTHSIPVPAVISTTKRFRCSRGPHGIVELVKRQAR